MEHFVPANQHHSLAKAPFTGAAYAGTIAITQTTGDFFSLACDLGGYKAKGVAYKSSTNLIGASRTSGECISARFKISSTGQLIGNASAADGTNSSYTMKNGLWRSNNTANKFAG